MAQLLGRFFTICVLLGNTFSKASTRPNVLFLVVDDLRPNLGCYGENSMITPNIDQLARKSVRFDRAYSQQAVCSPSRTSFLTGRRPDTTHIFDLKTYFRELGGNFTTLPEHFKNNGYITQSVGKIFHPGEASGGSDDYPYSWSFPAWHAPTLRYETSKTCPNPGGKVKKNACCPVSLAEVPEGTLPDIQIADFAVDFLRNRSVVDNSFFLAVGFHKPHLPFRYPKEYLDLYPLSNIHPAPDPFHPLHMPDVAWNPWSGLRAFDDMRSLNLSFPFGPVPPDNQLLLRQSYSAATSYTDAQIGRVLHSLDQYGLVSNTLVIFIGDHGWQLGEHQEWGKQTNFETAIRVPLLIHIPGMTSEVTTPGTNFPFQDALVSSEDPNIDARLQQVRQSQDASKSTRALVELVDLYATLAELSGLEIPPTCPQGKVSIAFCTEGSSFVPVIHNAASPSPNTTLQWKSAAFTQYPRPSTSIQHNSGSPNLADIHVMGYSMRTDEQRYTEWIGYDPTTFTANWTQVYARELYDHTADPDEDINVADDPQFARLVAQLSLQLRNGWREALPPSRNPLPPQPWRFSHVIHSNK